MPPLLFSLLNFQRARTIDRTTYETWPFPILNDNSDCNDQEIVGLLHADKLLITQRLLNLCL